MNPSKLVTSVLLLSIASPAMAWEHTGRVWLPEDMPIRYWVADDGQVGDIETCLGSAGQEACCEESVPAGYCTEAADLGYAAWSDALCAEYTAEYAGQCQNITQTGNNQNYITFNDPGSEIGAEFIAETGTWAVTTYPILNGQAFVLDGTVYTRVADSDIVFNNDSQFESHTNINAGQCNGGGNMLAIMTHEIGHLLGMDHSCEDPDKGGAPCTDPVLRDATMNWSVGACSNDVSINEDDIEGFTALYGPYATFECSHQVSDDLSVGIVPFDLNCVIVSESLTEVDSAQWNFGDGGTSSEVNPTHTYETPGNYTIQLTVHGERAACGEEGWTNNYRKVGYVRACGVPSAEFEVEHVDGLQYQLLNESDVSVYGCIADIQWDVFKGTNTSGEPIMPPVKAWEPIIDFPEAGEYTVVMNLGGIGGTGAAKLTFEAKNSRGEGYGCDHSGAPLGGFGLLIAGALAARRRRAQG